MQESNLFLKIIITCFTRNKLFQNNLFCPNFKKTCLPKNNLFGLIYVVLTYLCYFSIYMSKQPNWSLWVGYGLPSNDSGVINIHQLADAYQHGPSTGICIEFLASFCSMSPRDPQLHVVEGVRNRCSVLSVDRGECSWDRRQHPQLLGVSHGCSE